MRTYQQRCVHARRRELAADALAAGLACAVRGAASAGVLCASMGELACALPCAIIAVQEGAKALRGLKPAANAMQDGLLRAVRTCAAMAAGCAAGGWTGLAVAVTVRMLLDRSRSRLLTRARVHNRIRRLQQLRRQLSEAQESGALPQNKKKAEISGVIPLRIGKNTL